jgi:hypothetical protein
MDLLVERVDVWAATIQDRPGGLAEVLATLREAGADLQSIIARRAPGCRRTCALCRFHPADSLGAYSARL